MRRTSARQLGVLLASASVVAGAMVAGATPALAAAPGTPTLGTPTVGDGQVSVVVTPAAGDPTTSVTVTATPPDGIGSCGGLPLTCSVTGLTNGTSYVLQVVAHNADGDSLAASTASVTPKGPQTITFANPGTQTFGTTPTLSATTTSTSPVTFSSGTTAVCTVAGTTLTLVAAGSCTINANAVADATHTAAATVPQTFTVNGIAPGAPTIGTATPGVGSATVTFTAPASNGGSPITSYTVTSSNPALGAVCPGSPCQVGNLANGTPYNFTVKATNAFGTGPASAASNVITPNAAQTITFNNPGAQSMGTSPTLTATASSGLPVSFTSSTPSVCTVTTAGVLTLVSPGTCSITASQAGDATHAAAIPVLQSFTVNKPTPTVTVTASPTSAVYGQSITFTAALTAPVVAGPAQVQWSVDGTNVGSPVTLSSTGTATFTPTTPLTAGSHVVKASYAGDTSRGAASGQITQVVGKASTTTMVTVSGTTLTATVKPVAPGAGTPTGTVTFLVGGLSAGTATLNSTGVATLTTTTDSSEATVSASYAGDTNFTNSTGDRSPVVKPAVTAKVTSLHGKHGGWYRSPVTVSFTCTEGSAPLAQPCPAPVVLASSGSAQSVTKTVTATDGGSATVSVTGINIDRNRPKLTVTRHGLKLACHATDRLSGVASCRIHRVRHVHRGIVKVTWTAVAKDHAGNSTVTRGHFSYLA